MITYGGMPVIVTGRSNRHVFVVRANIQTGKTGEGRWILEEQLEGESRSEVYEAYNRAPHVSLTIKEA